MKVKFTRPHAGGGAMNDALPPDEKVVEMPDMDASGAATVIPEGGVEVPASTEVSDWHSTAPRFGRKATTNPTFAPAGGS